MRSEFKCVLVGMIAVLYLLSIVGATVVVDSVTLERLTPGKSSLLRVDLKNNFGEGVEDVSLVLNLENTGFSTVGSSESSQDRIRSKDDKVFTFQLKANNNLSPGDYNIPYTVHYKLDDNRTTQSGSFGVTVTADTELSFSVETEKNVVGSQGKMSLKIINSGLGDVKFVFVELSGTGFEILGSNEEYIGTVSSDDFEVSTFDVVYKSTSAKVNAIVKYKDLENREQVERVEIPVKVYTVEEGIQLGIIQKNNTFIWIALVVFLVVVWFIYRILKKRRKKKKIEGR